MLKTIVSLIAGFAILTFASILGTFGAAIVFGVQGNPPYPAGFNAALVVTSALAAVLGGYSTASLAPDRRTGHATVLALMLLVMYSYNVMSPTEGYPRSQFVWLLALCPPAAIAGGWLREMQVRRKAKAA